MRASSLRAWARERFPLANGAFFVLLYLLALVVGRAAVAGPIVCSWRDVPGAAALWLFFLWLRVLDEHKDFEQDRAAHPHRVLQRGLVTLGDLRVVGGVALAIQLAVSVWIDGGLGPVTTWWLLAVGWSALMAKEFFVRDWLRRHIIWYALSHMMVMVALVGWVAAMGAPDAGRMPATWVLAALVYGAGLAFEMGRKMRAPEDEHPSADSYTQAMGIAASVQTLAAVIAAVATLTLYTTYVMVGAVPLWLVVVVIAGAGLSFGVLHGFRGRPTPRGAKRVEAGVGVSILAMHALVLAAVLQGRGVEWR